MEYMWTETKRLIKIVLLECYSSEFRITINKDVFLVILFNLILEFDSNKRFTKQESLL